MLKDHLGNAFKLDRAPERIVSLVPSQTELLYDLGLGDKIVGITKFCVHPKHLKSGKAIVGGTKSVNFQKIAGLNPQIIVANKEENTFEMVSELQKICPVWVTDIVTMDDNCKMISDFGRLFACADIAAQMNANIASGYADFKLFIKNKPVKKAIYLIWKNPYMAAGHSTFINEMLRLSHFENVCRESRYPEIELREISADIILLSSEPFPFSEKDALEISAFSDAKITIVDGEMFSWYGSRVIKAFGYFKELRVKIDAH